MRWEDEGFARRYHDHFKVIFLLRCIEKHASILKHNSRFLRPIYRSEAQQLPTEFQIDIIDENQETLSYMAGRN
jgi:hypothetical protein